MPDQLSGPAACASSLDEYGWSSDTAAFLGVV
jgi:hypothetical protein